MNQTKQKQQVTGKGRFKQNFLFLLAIAIITIVLPLGLNGIKGNPISANAASVKLNKTKETIRTGDTLKLKLINSKGTVKWNSSNKAVASVSSKGIVKAKKSGKTTITAKYNRKSYSCKIQVFPKETKQLKKNGIYTSKDKVALYIHTYHKLPSNFITKDEAKKYGWNGGMDILNNLNKCIGGDRYYNFESSLPDKENRVYYECDINTLGAASRGAERLV